jgi:hypothetical protein
MGKWEPIFWIVGGGFAIFVFLLLLELLKAKKRKSDHA